MIIALHIAIVIGIIVLFNVFIKRSFILGQERERKRNQLTNELQEAVRSSNWQFLKNVLDNALDDYIKKSDNLDEGNSDQNGSNS